MQHIRAELESMRGENETNIGKTTNGLLKMSVWAGSLTAIAI